MSYNISEQIYTTTINIQCKNIVGDINKIILKYLKNNNENMCNNNGYIINDSIDIIERSIGEIKTINSNSYITYRIKYSAKILNVSVGDKIECIINSITKMGIISYIKLNESFSIKNSPLLIVTPLEFISSDKNIDDYKINDTIIVTVAAFRIKFKASNIQIISKIE